jgi:hypothetical protein
VRWRSERFRKYFEFIEYLKFIKLGEKTGDILSIFEIMFGYGRPRHALSLKYGEINYETCQRLIFNYQDLPGYLPARPARKPGRSLET